LLCPDCGEDKPLEEFPRNRNGRHGRGTYCKPCHNARNRETVRRRHGGYRHYRLKQKYGIGAAEVDALISAQGGLCALCEVRPATQVDHDHKTGKVRAILCLHCNAGMGAFKDDPDIIESAIKYLERNDGFASMP
jgi:Recombination endonuclease VII